MKRKWMITGAILSVFLIGSAMIGPIMSDVERPKYDVTSSSGNIEVREYAPMVVAEVAVSGVRKEAINAGFRILADYIFGNNIAKQDIAMTAPVQQQESTEIAMTAPVQQESSGDDWRVSFVMPSEYNIETLPEPVNDRVTLKEITAKKYVVITFSGTNSDSNMAEHEKELMEYVEANNLSVVGPMKYAFYNPPWTLPPMRRNEVMIEIEQ